MILKQTDVDSSDKGCSIKLEYAEVVANSIQVPY